MEAVQELTRQGLSFRDAYRQVAEQICQGKLKRPENITYSHEGSLGNLCNDKIKSKMDTVLDSFDFKTYESSLKQLLID